MSDVFVSYKREDEARVARLVLALQNQGLSVWWDRGLPGRESWRASIEAALADARCVVVVWTKNSTGPQGGFVQDEAARGASRGILVPVLLDKVQPPLGFGELQAIDLTGWRGSVRNAFFQDLPLEPLLLVADDDHDNAEQLALLLRTALRCEVVTAFDGGDALAQALARPPVAMILDLEMPVLSGAEVARQVRAACPEPPLMVVVSGNVRALEEMRAEAAPVFDQTFGKPLRFEQLLVVLEKRAGLLAH